MPGCARRRASPARTCFEPYRRGFDARSAQDRKRAEIEITILAAGHCGEMLYWNEPAG